MIKFVSGLAAGLLIPGLIAGGRLIHAVIVMRMSRSENNPHITVTAHTEQAAREINALTERCDVLLGKMRKINEQANSS